MRIVLSEERVVWVHGITVLLLHHVLLHSYYPWALTLELLSAVLVVHDLMCACVEYGIWNRRSYGYWLLVIGPAHSWYCFECVCDSFDKHG